MENKIIWPLTVLLGFIAGYAVCSLASQTKADYRRAVADAQRMEVLAGQLGNALEAERSIRAEIEDGLVVVERNLRAAAERSLDFEIRYSEVSIRNRAVEAALASLGIELSDIGVDISGVGNDIGSFIDGAESGTDAPSP